MLTKRFQFFEPTRAYRELRLLTEVAAQPGASLRKLAEAAFLGPTMVHNYVLEMSAQGWIEVEGENNRSYRYRLTPQGAYHRDELFFQASKEVVQFYGRAKQEFHDRLRGHARSGNRRVVLFGAAETAELVCAAAEGTGLSIVGIVDNDPRKHGRSLGGIPIESPTAIVRHRPDAVIITSFGHSDEIQEQIAPLENQGIRIVLI